MSFSYEFDHRLEALVPAVDEYSQWFDRVLQHIIYPENFDADSEIVTPRKLGEWIEREAVKGIVEYVEIEDLKQIDIRLQKLSSKLVKEARENKRPPESSAVQPFIALYRGFVAKLRHLEHDSVRVDSGIDVLSGLRSQQALYHDLGAELERLSRRGQFFCVVLINIDHYKDLKAQLSVAETQTMVKDVSSLIKNAMRSFDDAYRSDYAEFVMLLRHTDVSGGNIAIKRLRASMVDNPVVVERDGQKVDISLSYCASEPVPDDDIKYLLGNMRKDLKEYDDESKSLEYIEQSVLERYLNDAEE